MPLVAVVLGSKTDLPLMQPALDALEQLGVEYELAILSAHRQPERAREFGLSARERGLEVIIAGAGGAAHLPGVMASWTTLPVIGVPLATSALNGVDALYAVVQMPAGVPVACVAVNGAANAAYLAAQILGLRHEGIQEAYERVRQRLAEEA